MGNSSPTAMDQMRLKNFNVALNEMTRGVITEAAGDQTVCEDLGLVQSQAIDIIDRYFTYCEDLMFFIRGGYVVPPPVFQDGDRFHPEVIAEMTTKVPICAKGVSAFHSALKEGNFVRFYITTRTTVQDVIDFCKQVELMEIPPEITINDIAA